jgi:hypothetical protein
MNKVLIGFVRVTEEKEVMYAGFETASWYDKYQLMKGLFPVFLYPRGQEVYPTDSVYVHLTVKVLEEYRVNRLLWASSVDVRTPENKIGEHHLSFYLYQLSRIPGFEPLYFHEELGRTLVAEMEADRLAQEEKYSFLKYGGGSQYATTKMEEV